MRVITLTKSSMSSSPKDHLKMASKACELISVLDHDENSRVARDREMADGSVTESREPAHFSDHFLILLVVWENGKKGRKFYARG